MTMTIIFTKTNPSNRGVCVKTGIHPEYRPVVFRDRSAGYSFLTRSTMTSSTTVVWEDGGEYPVVEVDVSSASHPFYTGRSRTLDTAGRVEKFQRRYGKREAS